MRWPWQVSKKADNRVRETGERVPAVLLDSKGPAAGNAQATTKTMVWEAQLPEGGTLKFKVRLGWSLQPGIWLEAAVNEDRSRATLMLDLSKVPDQLTKNHKIIDASATAAARLRGLEGPATPHADQLRRYGITPEP